MTTIESAPITPDELAEMPDNNRFELVDGQLVERDKGAISSWVGGEVFRQIANHGEDSGLGWAFPAECGYQCFPDSPNTLRKPDASFIRRGRLPGDALPEGYIRIAPDLVVEVVSRHDAYEDVDEKLEAFFRAGVELVWIINPKSRTIQVYDRDGRVERLRERDELTGGTLLPGFRCRVGDLFPPAAISPAPHSGNPPAAG